MVPQGTINVWVNGSLLALSNVPGTCKEQNVVIISGMLQ